MRFSPHLTSRNFWSANCRKPGISDAALRLGQAHRSLKHGVWDCLTQTRFLKEKTNFGQYSRLYWEVFGEQHKDLSKPAAFQASVLAGQIWRMSLWMHAKCFSLPEGSWRMPWWDPFPLTGHERSVSRGWQQLVSTWLEHPSPIQATAAETNPIELPHTGLREVGDRQIPHWATTQPRVLPATAKALAQVHWGSWAQCLPVHRGK